MKARFRSSQFEGSIASPTEYELTGRVVFEMVEEGTTYAWEEFELVAPNGDCVFLEYDNGQWRLTKTFVPTNPIGPEEAASLRPGAPLSLDGTPAQVLQRVNATVRFVEGELTYRAMVGDKATYLDAHSFSGARLYCVEWSEDEIEFYRGENLSHRAVAEAFGLSNLGAMAADDEERRRKAKRRFAGVCLLLALLSFFFSFLAVGRKGTLVAAGPHTPIDTIPGEGVRFGPITLDPSQGVHRLTVHGAMLQSSAWAAAVLETPTEIDLVAAQGELWQESGVGADGSWSESSLEAGTYFVVPEAGTYYVRLYAEKESLVRKSDTVAYALHSGLVYPDHFPMYGVVAGFVSIAFFIASKKE